MNIDQRVKEKIHRVIYAFETGKQQADYAAFCVANDGPNGISMISYGKLQITEYGRLKELVEMYVNCYGRYYDQLKPYLDKIGKVSLAADPVFKNFLIYAAQNDDIMLDCQDILFDKYYWNPMLVWAENHDFTLNFSLLVLYDSFIQSGGILRFLRNSFSELTPDSGGDEKKWISGYIASRRNWLANKTKKVKNDKGEEISVPDEYLRETVYRMDCFLKILAAEDWNLDGEINANGNKIL